MSIRDIWDVVWRRRWLVLGIVALGALLVQLVGRPGNEAATTYRGTLNLSSATLTENNQLVLLYGYVATDTSQISELSAADLGPDFYGGNIDTMEYIESTVSVVVKPEIGVLTITAINQPDEARTAMVLRTFGQHIIDYAAGREGGERDERLVALERREEVLLIEIERLQSEIEAGQAGTPPGEQPPADPVREAQLASNLATLNSILAEKAAIEAASANEAEPLTFIGEAVVDPEPLPSNPLGYRARMALGVVMAAALGIGLALGLHRVDTRLFNRKDAEAAFEVPALTTVPKLSWRTRRKYRVITTERPLAAASQAYRVLRSAVARTLGANAASSPRRQNIVLVTSVTAGVGTSTTAANLAAAALDAGNRVLVVNADLREPALHEAFAVEQSKGIVDAVDQLRQGVAVDVHDYLIPIEKPAVSFLPHGGTEVVINPGEVLAAARPLIEQARGSFDMIIIDTPPMLAGNDVDELMPLADAMLFVVRSGQSTIEDGEWGRESAKRIGAPLAGLVLVGARSEQARSGRRGGLFRRLGRLLPGRSSKQIGSESVDDLPLLSEAEIDQALPTASVASAPAAAPPFTVTPAQQAQPVTPPQQAQPATPAQQAQPVTPPQPVPPPIAESGAAVPSAPPLDTPQPPATAVPAAADLDQGPAREAFIWRDIEAGTVEAGSGETNQEIVDEVDGPVPAPVDGDGDGIGVVTEQVDPAFLFPGAPGKPSPVVNLFPPTTPPSAGQSDSPAATSPATEPVEPAHQQTDADGAVESNGVGDGIDPATNGAANGALDHTAEGHGAEGHSAESHSAEDHSAEGHGADQNGSADDGADGDGDELVRTMLEDLGFYIVMPEGTESSGSAIDDPQADDDVDADPKSPRQATG